MRLITIQKPVNHDIEMLRFENPAFSGAFTGRNPELSDPEGPSMNVVMVVDDVSLGIYLSEIKIWQQADTY